MNLRYDYLVRELFFPKLKVPRILPLGWYCTWLAFILDRNFVASMLMCQVHVIGCHESHMVKKLTDPSK